MPDESRAREPELLGTKWFDYRDEHPVISTYRFAQAYEARFRRQYEKMVDADRAQLLHIFNKPDVFASRDLHSIWLARQAADALGIEYGFYVDFVIEQAFDRISHRIPRPNQLYGGAIDIDAKNAWEGHTRARMVFAKGSLYQAKNFDSKPPQIAHLEYLAKHIAGRERRPGLIERLVAEGIVDHRLAYQFFNQADCDQAFYFLQ